MGIVIRPSRRYHVIVDAIEPLLPVFVFHEDGHSFEI